MAKLSPRDLHTFENHERCKSVERGERKDDREKLPVLRLSQEAKDINHMRHIEPQCRHRGRSDFVNMQMPQNRNQDCTECNRQQCRGQTIRQPELRAVEG